uniref:Uncharacterized protein n=1 Tax=Corallina chilensis TaxID=2582857 RepID=A0A4P8VUN9_9FLOR|nr:hypothetical protein [Corallina chilensis]QCS25460.1 hypothetical protein [Corallina chilensis]
MLTFKPRLQSNHHLIDKYDIIDKYFFSKEVLPSLNKIDIFYNLDKNSNYYLNSLLITEFKSTQKPSLDVFKITLRKFYFYTYIELLIHTNFLENKIKYFNKTNNCFFQVKYITNLTNNNFLNKNFNYISSKSTTEYINFNFFNNIDIVPSTIYFLPEN